MHTEAAQLLRVKQLAQEAESLLSRETEFGDGLAVSLSQDAVELVLRIAMRTHNMRRDSERTLESMLTTIEKHNDGTLGKIPHRVRLEDLNKTRVQFKHYGTSPSRSDALRLVRYCVEFLEAFCPHFLGLEYHEISLVSTIEHESIRVRINAGVQALKEARFDDAMADAALAVNSIESLLQQILPLPRSPISATGKDAQALDALLQYLTSLRLISVATMMHFDPRDLLRFHQIAPFVAANRTKRYLAPSRSTPYTEEEARSAIDFATNFALSVQARIK